MAKRGLAQRLLVLALGGAMELFAAVLVSLALTAPASAQFFPFGDRFPFFGGERFRRPPVYQEPRAPVDYSHAPSPRKSETAPLTTIVVMGDSMADWLAYGLELAYADSPEMGVVRRHRTWSGLVRNDQKSDHPDWPATAREILAGENANFVVMMVGLNDRQSIRERPPVHPAPPKPTAQKNGKEAKDAKDAKEAKDGKDGKDQKETKDEQAANGEASAPSSQPTGPGGTYEFRSEKWADFYVKRIDETIAALKSKNVPVIWVGLPPIRGTKSMSDISYLNDLYRSRAEKAGIIYVDVWDGFVDESGRFAVQGPDFEGQIRRLRTPDGVYFTKAGARKLAHYVEREIQRVMNNRATPVSLPVTDEPLPQTPTPKPGTSMPRPMSGPVVPLTANVNESNELLGGGSPHQSVSDPTATRVLVKGDPIPAPAGRADDFAWPRRDVAPVGKDPVAATTTLPIPVLAERPPPAPADSESSESQKRTAEETAPRRRRATAFEPRSAPAPARRPNSFFPFFSFFGR